jgi:putative addiction module component (TIGR02574 family)
MQRQDHYASIGRNLESQVNAKTKALSQEAKKLSPEERIELIEDRQDSLDPIDPEIDRAWAEEALDRLAAYLRGELKATPFEEIVEKYRKP